MSDTDSAMLCLLAMIVLLGISAWRNGLAAYANGVRDGYGLAKSDPDHPGYQRARHILQKDGVLDFNEKAAP